MGGGTGTGGLPMRKRARILVEVDLDPVIGWGNVVGDHVSHISSFLEKTISHYNPQVEELDVNELLITLSMEEAGHLDVAESQPVCEDHYNCFKAAGHTDEPPEDEDPIIETAINTHYQQTEEDL